MELSPGPEHWSQGMAPGEAGAAQVATARVSAAAGPSLPRVAATADARGGLELIAAEHGDASGATGAADGGAAGRGSGSKGGDPGSDGSRSTQGGASQVTACQEDARGGSTANSRGT